MNSETALPYARGASSRGDGGGEAGVEVSFSASRRYDVPNNLHWQARHAFESTLSFADFASHEVVIILAGSVPRPNIIVISRKVVICDYSQWGSPECRTANNRSAFPGLSFSLYSFKSQQ